MYLFFDTETTGLPRDWNAPVTDLNNWPRMIQIGWILCDNDGNRIESGGCIIQPENYIIPVESSQVHGITTARAMSEGVNLERVLNQFEELIQRSDYIVGHNIGFDEKIIGAEFLRKNIRSSFNNKRRLCTMKLSTDYCKIPGRFGYKWPSLTELHIKLFGEGFEEAHDALADISATERSFWRLRQLGVI